MISDVEDCRKFQTMISNFLDCFIHLQHA